MRLAIVNLKGGTGKTTTAVHLATGLGRHGRTLLVDADPQGSAQSWSEAIGKDRPYDVVALPDRDLHRRVPPLMQQGGYEHLVVDTPPGHVEIVRHAGAMVGEVLVPLPPSLMDLDRLRPTLELLSRVEEGHQITVRILLTRVRSGTRSAKGVREVLAELGLPVCAVEIPLLEAYVTGFGMLPPEGHLYGALLDELTSERFAA